MTSSWDEPEEHEILTNLNFIWEWKERLFCTLFRLNLAAYVYDDVNFIPPATLPVREAEESASDYEARVGQYKYGKFLAFFAVYNRIAPRFRAGASLRRMTAKELIDQTVLLHEPRIDLAGALRNVQDCHMIGSNTRDYCAEFNSRMRYLQHGVDQSARLRGYETESMDLGSTLVNMMFWEGTRHHEWLYFWRTYNDPGKSDVSELMGSLKSEEPPPFDKKHPNERCYQCRHYHSNADCFKQHPETAPPGWIKRRKNRTRRTQDG